MKSAVLAFGALMYAAPAFAQAADPLAPAADPQKPAAQPAEPYRAEPLQPLSAPTVAIPPTPSSSAPSAPAPAVVQQPTVGATQIPAPPPALIVAIPRDWRGVFDAIDSGNWASARAGVAVLPPSVLTPVAKAEIYTAKGSPTVDLQSLLALIAEAPELPQADQLARMAITRGASTSPLIIPAKPVYSLGSAPVRYRAKPVQGEPAADTLRASLDPLVKTDDAAGGEALLVTQAPFLSVEARAEAGTRVAFVYYVLGLDIDARRVADTWRQGATGEWSSQGAWVSGLASWRLGDCESASRAFQQVV